MSKRLSKIYFVGFLTIAIVATALVLNNKSVLAAGYPGRQDVAIQGPNADIDDPVAHYRILATSGTPDVRIVDACLDQTAGTAGLRARIDGQDKNSNSNCSGNDIVFNNVTPNSILRIDKINGQGHQPFDIEATNAPGVHVTQLANPNYNVKAFGNDGDNYGVNVWGNPTLRFKVPCSVPDWTPIWIKWKDADVRQDNQTTYVAAWFREFDENGNMTWQFKRKISNLQTNNQPGGYTDFVRPGYSYEWQWVNVQNGNVIQHVLPFEDDVNQASCTPPPVRASCTTTATDYVPVAGTSINVTTTVKNTGTADWPSAVTVTGPVNHNPGTIGPGETRSYTDTFSSPSPGGVDYTYSVMDGATRLATCGVTVDWQSPVRITESSCGNLHIENPTSITFRLRFVDTSINSEVGLSPVYPAPFSVPPQPSYDYNTFVSFPFMVPHHTYYIEALSNDLTQSYDLSYVNNNRYCMSASCIGSLNGNEVEPGQSFSASYGVRIFNATGRTFDPGAYDAFAVTSGGLTITNSNVSSGPLSANANTDYVGPWNILANYGGTLTIHLRYSGSDIGGGVFNGAVYPCSQSYNPQTRTTLRVTNGDISTGGGFKYLQANGTQQCTLTSKRYFAPITAGGNTSVGGIRTFGWTPPYISSAQFAAYALGIIHSPGGPNNTARFGFFSDTVNKNVSKLSFANVGMTGGNLGGNLGGQFIDAHCAPDYFNETSNTLNPAYKNAGAGIINPDSLPLAPDGTGQFYYTNPAGTPVKIGGTLSNTAGIPRKRVTIFVNGDVLIANNITYGSWNFDLANKTNNTPYLTIIAKGNISVNFSVSRIEGVYIAQPLDDAGVTKGAFYTCSIAGAVPNGSQVKSSCHNTLSVNGSVIAQHVHLLRSQGTLQDNTGETAESFDFTPSTVIGLPAFRPESGSVIPNTLDSLQSLPPVF
jgi:hypothetical protein